MSDASIAILARSRSSFRFAIRLLPAPRRRALAAVYAVCREMDDVADGSGPAQNRAAALGVWARDLRAVFGGTGECVHPAARELAAAHARFGLPEAAFGALLGALRSDLGPVRKRSWEDLARYCDGVATSVGMACLPIFGVAADEGGEYARALGRGLQLVNIARDLSSDLRRDRIYWPAGELRSFGADVDRWRGGDACEAFADLLSLHTARAEAYLLHAGELCSALPRTARTALRPAEAMRFVYASLLERIRAAGPALLRSRPAASRFAAVAGVLRALLR